MDQTLEASAPCDAMSGLICLAAREVPRSSGPVKFAAMGLVPRVLPLLSLFNPRTRPCTSPPMAFPSPSRTPRLNQILQMRQPLAMQFCAIFVCFLLRPCLFLLFTRLQHEDPWDTLHEMTIGSTSLYWVGRLQVWHIEACLCLSLSMTWNVWEGHPAAACSTSQSQIA